MATVLGLAGSLRHGAAGATPTTVAANVADVTLSLETGEADVTTRGSDVDGAGQHGLAVPGLDNGEDRKSVV